MKFIHITIKYQFFTKKKNNRKKVPRVRYVLIIKFNLFLLKKSSPQGHLSLSPSKWHFLKECNI